MLFAVAMLLVAQVAFSQNITLKFTGATNDGRFARLDSVQVQNVSRSWSETVVYPDTVLIFQQTGIADAQGSTAEIASYPNPFNGTTNVAVTMPQSGDATLQVYNLAGQRVAERIMSLQAGKNLFEVRLQTAQVYLLAVTTAEGRSTIKLLNRGTGSDNSISYQGNSNIEEKRQSANPFQSGDVLKIIGYTTNNGTVVASREVLQPQTASENFTLFFTLPVAPVSPTVTTTTTSNITDSSATTGGNVTSDGGSAVTARGVCWSTSRNPTLSNSHTTNGSGTGIFSSSLTGLTAGTTYYVRAYAINSVDTAYGNQITFTTSAIAPTVTTTTASGITDSSATIGGNVTSDGGSAVTARGVCWSTSQNPTLSNSHTTNGSGTGIFSSSLTGLTAGTTYYVRAYAINSVDTAYGNQITFTTSAVAPTVTTTTASGITDSSVTTGGNVTSDGGSAVTARGVCWSTSHNPTLSNSHTTNGSGTGSFTSSLTGLTAGTTYYVRAYAINSVDTAYGNQITFTTTAVAPTVTTTSASSITSTTATTGGNVTSDGGDSVTARGVCWSTSQNPTLSNSHTSNGSGTGSFTSSLTGLTAGTTYYVRAYAINSVDTAYGNQIMFTTTAYTFSVSAGTSVFFSPGNLQWSATNGGSTATTHTVAGGGTAAGTWRFATNQWDTIGANNGSISSSYSGWIDLFGWGTSGFNSKYPYISTIDSNNYVNGNDDIARTNYDWGVYNAIYNPKTSTTDAPGTWRTLTRAEWNYLINTRTTTSGIRYAKARVNGVPGIILVPDNWSTSTYTLNLTNTDSAAYTTNVITSLQWTTLENAGCAFLPAAGLRYGTSVNWVGSGGYYWSARYGSIGSASDLWFNSGNANIGYSYRFYGNSVRLVRSATTTVVAPTVTTTTASDITTTTATTGGDVISDGYSAVTSRGVCWSTSQNPTLSNNHTTNGSGTGSFISSLTGLTAGTTYYVRAYAINSVDTAYGNQITFTTTAYTFSVSAGTRVLFSPGNLQWSAKNGGSTATTHTVAGGGTAAGTWRFAPNQWDTIGANNSNISSSYSGWIDFFGWGTSGWDNGNHCYQPYNSSNDRSSPYTSSNGYGYGPTDGTTYTYSLLGTYARADWGVYNAIYNPKTSTTDAPGTWRTPTNDEWTYLLNTRSTTSGVRYAKATVNGVPGLIIVPDNWSTSTYALYSTNASRAAYTTNVISSAQWTTLENAGCVFLPAAGDRYGTLISLVGNGGAYWSATYYVRYNVYGVYFDQAYCVSETDSGLDTSESSYRFSGHSVRLVKDVQ